MCSLQDLSSLELLIELERFVGCVGSEMFWLALLLALVPFYLLGSFPSGYLLARLHGVDITKQGSGNVGATNVARTLGKKVGLLTLLLDLAKGAIGVYLAGLVSPVAWYPAAVAFAVICGHCFSLPPVLRGGKGVATGIGVLIALVPGAAVTSIVLFAILFASTRLVSLASLVATLSAPIYSLVTNQPDIVSFSLVAISLIIVFRHYENIVRLIEGREPKFVSTTKSA
jgi:glycerol-3-phosphate acyltransferase PlsY